MEYDALDRPSPGQKRPNRTTKLHVSIDAAYDGALVVLKATLTEDAHMMPFMASSRALVSRLVRSHRDFDAAWESLLTDLRSRVLERQTDNPLFLALPEFLRPLQRIVPEGAVPMLEHLKNRHIGAPALVIGNGTSRRDVDLSAWPGITIGCNALIRDFVPDYLVAMDEAMLEEVVKLDRHRVLLARRSSWGTRPMNDRTFLFDHDHFPPQTLCAGAAAYWAACLMGCQPIVLVGFDGVANPQNIYRQTDNYIERCEDRDINLEHDQVLLRVSDYYGDRRAHTLLVWPPAADHSFPFQRISWDGALALAYGQQQ